MCSYFWTFFKHMFLYKRTQRSTIEARLPPPPSALMPSTERQAAPKRRADRLCPAKPPRPHAPQFPALCRPPESRAGRPASRKPSAPQAIYSKHENGDLQNAGPQTESEDAGSASLRGGTRSRPSRRSSTPQWRGSAGRIRDCAGRRRPSESPSRWRCRCPRPWRPRFRRSRSDR